MNKVVVLSGAGISAESGLATFRDQDGLWNGHRVEDVATPQAFKRNPELVLDFYNQRRRQLKEVMPNAGHFALVALEDSFEVTIITQNVDDLHVRAGSSNVIHLHGELLKAKSLTDESYRIEMTGDILPGDFCPNGGQLRPDIVWFGEQVPLLPIAAQIVSEADYLLIVGTSLQVYPAAGLVEYASDDCKIFYFDKNPAAGLAHNVQVIKGPSGETLPPFVKNLGL